MPPGNPAIEIAIPPRSALLRRLLLEQKLGPNYAQVLARQLKCDPSLVSHVIAGRRKNPCIRRAIAKVLGEKIDSLFESCAT